MGASPGVKTYPRMSAASKNQLVLCLRGLHTHAGSRIGMVEMRLSLVDSLINSLQKSYQKYQSEHA
jgi:hypothetical protein